MNCFPTNNSTSPDHANHPSIPFTPRQLGSLDEGTSTDIDDLFSNDLLGFDADPHAVHTPGVPPHGTPRHAKPHVHRRFDKIHRRRHGRPGTIPKKYSSQRIGFNAASPPTNILATVAPQRPFDGAYTYPPPSLAGPSSAMFEHGVPRFHVGPNMLVPQATPRSDTFPQSIGTTHAAPSLASQLTVDVFSDVSRAIPHPPASCPPGSSSAAFEKGELERQASFSGIQNIPMTSGSLPSGRASSSSLTWTTPIIPAANPVVLPWDADTATMGPSVATIPAITSTAPAGTELPRVPVSRCTCCQRVHPLVRVDETIEWIRPDVMKMVLYFNWSSEADAEAHENWEPYGPGE